MDDLMKCRVCGKLFDMSCLDQVIYHETHEPIIAPEYSGSRLLEAEAEFFANNPPEADRWKDFADE